MSDIIREALEAYKSLAEDMHDTVCQSFSDDIDLCIKALAALDMPDANMLNMYELPAGNELRQEVTNSDYGSAVQISFGIYKNGNPIVRNFILMEPSDAANLMHKLAALLGTKETT